LDPFSYKGVPAADGHVYEFWHFVKKHVYAGDAAGRCRRGELRPTAGDGDAGHRGVDRARGTGRVGQYRQRVERVQSAVLSGPARNALGGGRQLGERDGPRNETRIRPGPSGGVERRSDTGRRCKPDVIAPGNCLVAQTDSDQGYTVAGDWSSYATPIAAGVPWDCWSRPPGRIESQSGRVAGEAAVAFKAILMSSA
jgi:hypothetical protein